MTTTKKNTPRYYVQRTMVSGHWHTLFTTSVLRRAVVTARWVARQHYYGRRRVTVRVHTPRQIPCNLAVWINGRPVAGLAFPKLRTR